jgi:hypothetical protein
MAGVQPLQDVSCTLHYFGIIDEFFLLLTRNGGKWRPSLTACVKRLVHNAWN